MSLAMKLQKLRTQRGQSLQVVADAVGASKAHIWELEKGTTKNPSIELLTALSRCLDVSVAELIGENPDGSSDSQLVAMYRDLQELSPDDRKAIQSMMDHFRKRGS